tara:strand:- start:2433 stop:2762 length:330 start_codon:yes stop_codon:yes gene_type:complete
MDDRLIIINGLEEYSSVFEEKNVESIRQYGTPNFQYPSAEQMRDLNLIRHIWKTGDKLFKLAYKHYGDPKLWYIIAWFNKRPTESHFKYGDVILVPHPLSLVTKMLKNR